MLFPGPVMTGRIELVPEAAIIIQRSGGSQCNFYGTFFYFFYQVGILDNFRSFLDQPGRFDIMTDRRSAWNATAIHR